MKKDHYLAPARITPYTGSYPAKFLKVTLYCICKINNSYVCKDSIKVYLVR